MTLRRRTACQTLSKPFNISSAVGLVAWDMLKALTILSDQTVGRFASERGNLKPCRKSGKTAHFSKWSKSSSFFTVFSKILLTIERRLAGRYFSGVGLSSTFLNTGTTDNTFQKLENKIPLNTEKISWYLWKLGFTIFQNHHWNKIRARRLWKIEIYLFYYKQV